MIIEKIMTKNVLTLAPTAPFFKIQEVFQQVPFHHLLIKEEDKLVGLVSDRDMMNQVAKYITQHNTSDISNFLSKLTVADVMTKDMIVIDKDTAVSAASVLLLENNFSCLPVVDRHQHIDGIVTWKDLLNYYVYL